VEGWTYNTLGQDCARTSVECKKEEFGGEVVVCSCACVTCGLGNRESWRGATWLSLLFWVEETKAVVVVVVVVASGAEGRPKRDKRYIFFI
jgi:hypothetical protein